jgi:pimeloyl-ACP methyl ester carboxylesterase
MTGRLMALAAAAVVLAAAAPARADDRPVVFLHGLGAEASDWAATADRLKTMIALSPRAPELPWRSTYEEQAASVQARPDYAALSSTAVAVGHSNGGVVAREWSKLHALGGIVTIGTPHAGAPILYRLNTWLGFTFETPVVLNTVVDAFSQVTDWNWIFIYVDDILHWTSDFSLWSVVHLVTELGADEALPVAYEMFPNSGYLAGLNGSSNLARESAAVPNRVGIASIAHNYFYAGPARAVAPEDADAIATAMYAAAFGLLAWSDYIFLEAPATDVAAMEQALSLMTVADHILSIDPVYCRLVSRLDASECLPNDGIVPVDSQAYPNAPNLLIGTANDGPAHKQEKQMSDDALYLALTTYMHVPPRTEATEPAPPPPVPPPPAPDPVVEPEPEPEPPPADPVDPDEGEDAPWVEGVLAADEWLAPGDVLDAANGIRHLSYQGDGNLVIYDENWLPRWASGTAGTSAGGVLMQSDGNLVIYDAAGVPVWASNTVGHPGAFLIVQADGNVVIYDEQGVPLWAADTL